MVAYSFQPRFVEPIRSGIKFGTIRALSKRRHAKPGERLQLYCRQRRPDGFKIVPDVTCARVNAIEFDLRDVRDPRLISNGVEIPAFSLEADQFARSDGFTVSNDAVREFHNMVIFWYATHGHILFHGVHILWAEPQKAAATPPAKCIKADEIA